jgi:tetratricopeptide (TPR) repeat protein
MLVVSLSIALLVISGGVTLNLNADAQEDALTTEYDGLTNSFNENLKTIKTRDEYKKLLDEHNKALETLLGKVEQAGSADATKLLRGKLLFDLKKPAEAKTEFEALITKSSPLADKAKFEKVRVLIQAEKNHKDGLALFREIEKTVAKTNNYYWIIGDLAFSAEDDTIKEEFSHRFIKEVENVKEFQAYIPMAYNNLAEIKKEQGDLKKAIEILEKGISLTKDERGKQRLTSTLGLFKLYGSPAPEIAAKSWLNTTGNVALFEKPERKSGGYRFLGHLVRSLPQSHAHPC